MDTHLLLSLFHIFGVVPFFLYIALNRSSTSTFIYRIAFVLGIIITLYHGMKAVKKYYAGSQSLWVNLLHVLFVGPLLAYIGYMGEQTPRSAYELLALAAFGALGYHTYYLITMVNVVDDKPSN